MTLNYDCIRDVLLFIESFSCTNEKSLKLEDFKNGAISEKYAFNDVIYSIIILGEGGFIISRINCSYNKVFGVVVERLTYDGHIFLEKIKSDDIWKRVKEISFKIGIMSFDVISQITDIMLERDIKLQLSILC